MTTHGRAQTPASWRVPDCLCGMQGIRDDKTDTYYCPASGVPLEEKCGDPECYMCEGRPEIFPVVKQRTD